MPCHDMVDRIMNYIYTKIIQTRQDNIGQAKPQINSSYIYIQIHCDQIFNFRKQKIKKIIMNNHYQISRCYLSLDQNLFLDKVEDKCKSKSKCIREQKDKQEQNQRGRMGKNFQIQYQFQLKEKKNAKLIARYKFNKKLFKKQCKKQSYLNDQNDQKDQSNQNLQKNQGDEDDENNKSTQKLWMEFVQKTDQTIAKKPKMKCFYDLYRETLQQKRIFIRQNQLKKQFNLPDYSIYVQPSCKKSKNQNRFSYSNKGIILQSQALYPKKNKQHSALDLQHLHNYMHKNQDLLYSQQPNNSNKRKFTKIIQRKIHTQGVQKANLNLNVNKHKQELMHNDDGKINHIATKYNHSKRSITLQNEDSLNLNPIINLNFNRTKNMKFLIKKSRQFCSHNKEDKKLKLKQEYENSFHQKNQHNQRIINYKLTQNQQIINQLKKKKPMSVNRFSQQPLILQYRIKSLKKHQHELSSIDLQNYHSSLMYKQANANSNSNHNFITCENHKLKKQVQKNEKSQRKHDLQNNFQNESQKQQSEYNRHQNKLQGQREDQCQHESQHFHIIQTIQSSKQKKQKSKKLLKVKINTPYNIKSANLMMNGSVSGWKASDQKFQQPF